MFIYIPVARFYNINYKQQELMKTSRLLAYGALGIISGLLIENRALIFKQKTKDKANKLKQKINKATSGH